MKNSILCHIFTVYLSIFYVVSTVFGGTRAIVVDSEMSGPLAAEINQLREDYEAVGASVEVIEVPDNKPFSSWTAHQWVKDSLSSIVELEGAILLGNVPTGWFSDPVGIRPSDLVYRMPNATFIDNEGDGVFDSIEGVTKAKISIGRVTPLNSSWQIESPVEQVRTYLQRIHQVRNGQLNKPSVRGLNYIDSPFGRMDGATPITGPMKNLYGDNGVTTVADASVGSAYDITTPEDFRTYLEDQEGYEFVTLHVHGNPAQSIFHTANDGGGSSQSGIINSVDYRLWNTHASWYLFTSCSTCNYGQTFNGFPEVQSEFLCGSARHGGNTLGVIAPSFSVAMEYSEGIFNAMRMGAGVGLAMNHWFNYAVEDNGRDPNSNMLKGFQLFGDPWLRSEKNPQVAANMDRIVLHRPGSFQSWIMSRWLLPRLRITPPSRGESNILLWTYSETVHKLTVSWDIRETWSVTFPWNRKEMRIVRINPSPSWPGIGGWVTDLKENAIYSVRPVFSDGNTGTWSASCSVNHQSNPWLAYTDCK